MLPAVHMMISTAVRLFASWWAVEFVTGAASEWRGITADRRELGRRRNRTVPAASARGIPLDGA
jgi:hypothetical protein